MVLKCCLEFNYDPKNDNSDSSPNQWYETKTSCNACSEAWYLRHEAAQEYAQHLCSQDSDYYQTFLDNETVVLVKDSTGAIHKMIVSAEQSIEFTATEIKPKDKGQP